MSTNYEQFLRTSLAKYQFADLTTRDVLNVFQQFRDLRPGYEGYVFNNGSKKNLLNLDGTIPVSYRNVTYNIPVCIWMLDTHPYNPPIVFVKPTSSMMIKQGLHVDANGKVDLPYLRDWEYPEWDLLGLIQILVLLFNENPPLFLCVEPQSRSSNLPNQAGNSHEQIQIGENSTGHGYEKLFAKFLDRFLTEVEIEDPYIRSTHQVYNLLHFCEMLVKSQSSVTNVRLCTGRDENEESRKQQHHRLEQLTSSLHKHGIELIVEYNDTLDNREIRFNNGWILKIGRGLDMYKALDTKFSIGFCDFDLRPCHKTTVDIFRTNY